MPVRSQTLQLSSSTPGAAHHMLMFTPHAPCSLYARSVGRSVSLANLMQDAATYLYLYPYQEETAAQHNTGDPYTMPRWLPWLVDEWNGPMPETRSTNGAGPPPAGAGAGTAKVFEGPETHSSQPAPSIPSVSTGAGTLGTGDWDCDYDCDRGGVVCGIVNCVDGGGRGGWGDDDTYRQKPIPATIHNPQSTSEAQVLSSIGKHGSWVGREAWPEDGRRGRGGEWACVGRQRRTTVRHVLRTAYPSRSLLRSPLTSVIVRWSLVNEPSPSAGTKGWRRRGPEKRGALVPSNWEECPSFSGFCDVRISGTGNTGRAGPSHWEQEDWNRVPKVGPA
ncbi:hypothetical protein CSIM01_02785 [Colletotrichum simmondsii]|uniref:Uncharacterized protein n=1 Tax=Colletotrichum simmondsii TaxID=703756 RepID=A0A135T1C6_9PEZI|nr:hypothetical protein CSIM01_02785 [Colletotrichum simmondsii]